MQGTGPATDMTAACLSQLHSLQGLGRGCLQHLGVLSTLLELKLDYLMALARVLDQRTKS